MTPKNHATLVHHPDTGFISVDGDEACAFLQSIITANVETLRVGSCCPCALLTAQGRILIDMMVYRPKQNHFILRSDAARCDDLFTRLRRYRLRRPIELSLEPNFQLYLLMQNHNSNSDINFDMLNGITTIMSCIDPRSNALGIHVIVHDSQMPTTNGDITAWHKSRIAAGIPEGSIDLIPERALMLEAGLDQLGAVDFEKGCYVGQEVTARMHYRGLVKRRLVPLVVAGDPPIIDSTIIWNEKIIGNSKSTAPFNTTSNPKDISAICHALLKITDINSILESTNGGLKVGGRAASLAVPEWMIPLPHLTKK